MEWQETPESSNLSRIGYDSDNQILMVQFKNGSLYNYYDVPGHVYQDMCIAPSKGQYLAQVIKGAYRYARA